MTMKKALIFSSYILLSGLAHTASSQQYSKLKLWLNDFQFTQLWQAGVALDHGSRKQDTWFIGDFSEDEIAIIDESGIDYDVLIADVTTYYQQRNHSHSGSVGFGNPHLRSHARSSCATSTPSFADPGNFSLGTMGGYLKYSEFIQHIDAMAAQYPNLISTKAAIPGFQTHESRPIYWLRISNQPNVDQGKPQVLYTAIHHAREPASLSQLIYYMWYLLENYGTNSEVTYLVDNTEMFFIPMINPDGYVFNETNNPTGGGMWRKNRRNNGATFGVDLNRNYSYAWNTTGVSSNPASDVYPGPSAFSEPETQAVKWFTENRDIKIALNYHTYGNLLLYPFGHQSIQSADHNQFDIWSGWMVRQNGYNNMLSSWLYPASGDSDDWMYDGDLGTKPKVFAMTPETGSDVHGFWPASAEILPLCRENLTQNLTAAHLLLDYAKVVDKSPAVYSVLNGYIKYDLTRLGLLPGNFTVSIQPVGFGINSVGVDKVHNGMNLLDVKFDSISFTLDPSIQPGQTFRVAISWSNGNYTYRDTLTKVYGSSTTVFADNGSTLTNWTSTTWGTTTAEFVSAPSSITDSPLGDYPNNANRILTLNNPIDLANAVQAELSFFAKWDIEKGYDYAQLQASTNGGSTWEGLCGLYTVSGSSNQDNGKPLWDGTQLSWVVERIDLSDYLGQNLLLRFRLRSDGGVVADGFYFDDFEVNIIETGPQSVAVLETMVARIYPNPVNDLLKVQYQSDSPIGILLTDATGKIVADYGNVFTASTAQLNVSGLANGVYQLILTNKAGNRLVHKVVVFH